MEGTDNGATVVPFAGVKDAGAPLERAFERLGEMHELLHLVDRDQTHIDDALLDLRLASLRRTLTAAGDRLAQLRVAERTQGTWLDTSRRSER